MRTLLAHLLHRLAEWVHPADHQEIIEVQDDYGIVRCRVQVVGDDRHGIDTAFVRLPTGWDCHVEGNTHDFSRSDAD